MKVGHFLTPYKTTNSECVKDLNVRPETIKFLEDSIGSNVSDISHNNIFLYMSPEARETKAKLNYWDSVKVKGFCTAKETISKTKRQSRDREKIFANDVSNKGLISKIQRIYTTQHTNKKPK